MRSEATHRRLFCALFVPLAACGSSPAVVGAPTAAAVAASAAPAPQPDVSPVPEPAGLALVGRVASLGASLAVLRGWSKGRTSESKQVADRLLGENLGPLVDLDQPIDMAIAAVGLNVPTLPRMVVSVAVKDPERARAFLSERFKLVPALAGATLLEPIGPSSGSDATPENREESSDVDDPLFERVCELAPSYGAARVRLVCGQNATSLAELGPYLTRTATRIRWTSDVHLDVRTPPLHAAIADLKRLLTLAFETTKSLRSISGLGVLLRGVAADAIDFASDLDTATVDVTIDDAGIRSSSKLRFSASTSAMARLATANAARGGPIPTAFWRLPGDADFAVFDRGVDAAEVARGRDWLLRAVGEGLDSDGVREVDRAAVLAALAKLVGVAPTAYASGCDAFAVQSALAAKTSMGNQAVGAQRMAAEALLGWRIFELDQASAKTEAGMKDLASALARPGIADAYRKKTGGAAPLAFRALPAPRGSFFASGTAYHVFEIAAADTAGRVPAPVSRPGAAQRKPNGDEHGGKALVVHAIVVPDGNRTWVGVGADEPLLVAKISAAIGTVGDTMSSRPELAELKTASVGAAGFFTARGLLASAGYVGALLGEPLWGYLDAVDGATNAAGRGLAGIPFSLTAQPDDTPNTVLFVLKAPPAAIEDVLEVLGNTGVF